MNSEIQLEEATNIGSGRVHGWERFWVPRTGNIDLSDAGFMVDPKDGMRQAGTSPIATLPALADYRALVLLGEPGMGKSMALAADSARVNSGGDAAGIISIHADLRAYSSEVLLYQRVFESPAFVAWRDSATHLILHLDSLDEALLRIDTIANLIANALPDFPTERMSLRIACRTAVWPEMTLEPALRTIWGEKAVGVFELTPLRRLDVIMAAEAQQIDPDAFIKEVFAANAVPFAIKPLTLNLLLGLYRRDGRLPHSLAELYRLGCLRLCEEQNASRRDSRRLGALDPAQRLRVASRLAAVTMLANRYAIWTGPETDIFPQEDVPLAKISVGGEEGDFQGFNVTPDVIREVLDTGLFSSRGASRMGWAHQSYAEFLAALYLIEKGVSAQNILKLLLHPAGGLVPQLSVAAGWTASLHKDVRAGLIALEPMALLQGDLANWGDDDLAALTRSLLMAYAERHVSDAVPGIANAYARLNFPGLAALLEPYVTDRDKNLVARRAAFMIAEACKLKALQPQLLHVALDVADEPSLRARAVAALATCGDESIYGQLMPLAKGECGPDPNAQIKGHALQILWPGHISSSDLFATLTDPSSGFFGAYAMFLTMLLPQRLVVGDLPDALRWATQFINSAGHSGDYHRMQLADAILVQAWKHFEDPALKDLLIAHVFALLRHGRELLRGTDYRSHRAFLTDLKSDTERRHSFLLAAAARRFERYDAFSFVRASLLFRADFGWLLSLCPGGEAVAAGLNEESLCNMIDVTFDANDAGHFEALYDASMKCDVLRRRYAWLFDGILIDSADAKQQRETYMLMRELDENRQPPISPPPAERVRACLDRYEAGDIEGWWLLNLELTLAEGRTHYGSDLDYFITEMPGWREADEPTRERIVAAAEGYLSRATPAIEQWVGTTAVRRTDLSAYRALILLREVRREVYEQLPAAIWQKWAPVIVAIPKETGTDKATVYEEIEGKASAAAPREIAETVVKMIRSERARAIQAKEGGQSEQPISFFSVRSLEKCWDNALLKGAVFTELQSPENSADQFRELLSALLKASFDPARDYATSVLQDARPERRAYMLAAAAELASHCAAHAWPAAWKIVLADTGFGRDLFVDLAHHYRFGSSFLSELDEAQLGDLHVWLEREFPRADDPRHQAGEAHWVGPRESVGELRDSVLRHLVSRGTVASVQVLRRNITLLSDLTWLPYYLREAEQIMRTKTWTPLTPMEVLRVAGRPRSRLVQSAADLCDVLIEALGQYQRELYGAQTPVQDLWDRQGDGSLRPVAEDGLSDHVTRFLRGALGQNGIISNREVEIGRVLGMPIGSRTDIKIEALRLAEDGMRYDAITAVIETKGCWHAELFRALETQLYGDYLTRLGAPVGIYLVGWFDKAKWDVNDSRRGQAPNCTLEEAQERLSAQGAAVPADFLVRAVVLDCHAP